MGQPAQAFSTEAHMPWLDACSAARLARAGVLEAEAGGAALLLYDLGGTAYATAAVCPHHAAWLIQGSVSGDCVDCPRHMGRFHIPTGEQRGGPPCPPLRTYPVRIEAGRVLVLVDA
jgi:3-phenylpropionate/trans-cinnamate dioxygenase ferredoxin subunit